MSLFETLNVGINNDILINPTPVFHCNDLLALAQLVLFSNL